MLVALAFTPGLTACTIWEADRKLLRRESESRQYSVGAFYIAKSLISIPFQAVVSVTDGPMQ